MKSGFKDDYTLAAESRLLGRLDSAEYSRLAPELGVKIEDIPMPEVLEQAEADRLYLENLTLGFVLADTQKRLDSSRKVGNHFQRVAWLRSAGYEGVRVRGKSEAVPLNQAPESNVYSFYQRVKKELEAEVRDLSQ